MSKKKKSTTAYELLMVFDYNLFSEIVEFMQPSFVVKILRLVNRKFREIAENPYTWRAIRVVQFGRKGIDLLKKFFAAKDDVDSAKYKPDTDVMPLHGHYIEFYRRCVHLVRRTQKCFSHIRYDLRMIFDEKGTEFAIKRLTSHYIDTNTVVARYGSYNEQLKEDVISLQKLMLVKIDNYKKAGHTYIGEILDGKPDGYGEVYLKNCVLYAGEFKGGKKNGFGTRYLLDGRKLFEGDYKDDVKHGEVMRFVHVPKSFRVTRIYFLEFNNDNPIYGATDKMYVYHPYTEEYAGKYVGSLTSDGINNFKCHGLGSIFDHNDKHVLSGRFVDGKLDKKKTRVYTDILRMYKKRN
jgi:hypothetical protein